MATLTIRNLPDDVRDKLRIQAVRNGRSTEAEVRVLLAEAVGEEARATDGEYRARVARLQAEMKRYARPGHSIVDELIAERRWEAACDEAEAFGRPKPPRSDFVKDD